MEFRLMFLLLLCEAGQSSVIQPIIVYQPYPGSWEYAQTYCQNNGGMELLTVVTQSEIDYMNMDSYYAWIGLKHYDDEWWQWINSFLITDQYFVNYEPNPNDDCAMTAFKSNGAIGDLCQSRHFFFCHHWENTQKFSFYHEAKSWDEAFKFCKNKKQDFAIFYNWNDLPSDDEREFPVWTGLYHDGESWRWSDGEYSDYWKWAPGFEPGPSPGSGLCGSVWSQNKSMSVHSCSEAFPFLCYSHNLVLVKQNLTWEEALEQCKNVSSAQPHQLLSVDQSELLYANSKAIDAQTDKVWLGLRFLGGSWFWSNGQTVTMPDLPSCPPSTLGCGALMLDRTSNGSEPQPTIKLSDCSERLNLLCYRL